MAGSGQEVAKHVGKAELRAHATFGGTRLPLRSCMASLKQGSSRGTVKGFGIVNKAEIDAFLELSCFLDDPADVGNLVSGSSAFSKSSLNAEGSGAGGVQTAKASRKQSSLSGKESAQGCIPKRLLGRPD